MIFFKTATTAIPILGIYNEEADQESRRQELRTAWKLNTKDLQYVIKQLLFVPYIFFLPQGGTKKSQNSYHTKQTQNVLQ